MKPELVLTAGKITNTLFIDFGGQANDEQDLWEILDLRVKQVLRKRRRLAVERMAISEQAHDPHQP